MAKLVSAFFGSRSLPVLVPGLAYVAALSIGAGGFASYLGAAFLDSAIAFVFLGRNVFAESSPDIVDHPQLTKLVELKTQVRAMAGQMSDELAGFLIVFSTFCTGMVWPLWIVMLALRLLGLRRSES